jgi:hypothetical protein
MSKTYTPLRTNVSELPARTVTRGWAPGANSWLSSRRISTQFVPNAPSADAATFSSSAESAAETIRFGEMPARSGCERIHRSHQRATLAQ